MRVSAFAVVPVALALLGPISTTAAGASAHANLSPSRSHAALPGFAKKKTKPKPVTLDVHTGYGGGLFRSTAWVPVRVAITNHTTRDMSGTLEIPESSQNNGPPQPYHALYETPVTLPSGSTKHVVLYIPGSDPGSELDVRFRGPNGLTAYGSDYPNSVADSDVTVGVLSGTRQDAAWLQRINMFVSLDVSALSPATLDPVPDALANFDIIALTDVDSSRLDREQFDALTRYVHRGGTLLIVGGPDWQETLRPLPAALLPGRLVGARTLPNLDGLRAIAGPSPTKGSTTVSVLAQPRGTVLAEQAGVTLAVREGLGSGAITYLAFDPAVSPIAGWDGANALLSRVLSIAAPAAFAQASAPLNNGPGASFQNRFMGYGPGGGMATELANIPSAALPSLILFIALAALYILLLGPGNYLVLRRLRRLELSWLTIPLLGVLCVATTFGVAYRVKGSTVLLNTLGFVALDGTRPAPVNLYVGLFAPVRGDYRLTLSRPSLPSTIPEFDGYMPGGGGHTAEVRLREGAGTDVSFQSMNMWSSRSVALETTATIDGTVTSSLHLDAEGRIVGEVHNGTRYTLLHPVVMAGQQVTHLPDLPAGVSAHVKFFPNADVYNMDPGVGNPYGNPNWVPGGGPSTGIFGFFAGNGPCCYGGPQLPQEKNFQDRIRNAITTMPDAWTISSMSEVMFLGWTDAPLVPLTVDGGTPRRRDLTLIASPLSVGLPSGPFKLRSGTFGAHLVDVTLSDSTVFSNGCCGPFQNKLEVGSGGSLTFQYQIPRPHHVHFRSLTLWVNAGGADGYRLGRIYDWRAGRWVTVDLTFGSADLHNPDRIVSPDGKLLLRLAPTTQSHDVQIMNPYRNLQLVGSGVAS